MGNDCLNEEGISFQGDENFPELISDNGYTTWRRY